MCIARFFFYSVQDGAVAHLDMPTAVVEQEEVEPEADEPEQSADDEDDLPSLPATAEGQDEQVPLPTHYLRKIRHTHTSVTSPHDTLFT